MRKVLLVLALMVLAAPAFCADVQLFFTRTATAPTAVTAVPYTSNQNSTVTLYLWAKLNVASVGSLAIDFDFVGDITSPQFVRNDINYGPDTAGYAVAAALTSPVYSGPFDWSLHAWDVSNSFVFEPRIVDETDGTRFLPKPAYDISIPLAGASLNDVKFISFDGEGLKQGFVANNIFLLGTLTFTTTFHPWYVHMATGASADLAGNAAATVLYGAGELQCSGDPTQTPLSDSWVLTETSPGVFERVYDNTKSDAKGWTKKGDFNADGTVSFGDLPGFKSALINAAAWTASHPGQDGVILGDFNGDLAVSFGDLPGFKAALISGGTIIP